MYCGDETTTNYNRAFCKAQTLAVINAYLPSHPVLRSAYPLPRRQREVSPSQAYAFPCMSGQSVCFPIRQRGPTLKADIFSPAANLLYRQTAISISGFPGHGI